jgi:DNA topoisomerase-1
VDVLARVAERPPYLFRASGRTLLFDGFLRVWEEPEEKGDADEDEPQTLPELTAGEPLDLLELIPRQHFTQPPPRYTEASLVKALEERGIGRPSTYASIVTTLKERTYVVLERRLLYPTPLGEATCDALLAAFPEAMDYGFTAQVEDWLDDVSRADKDWVGVLHEFYGPFAQALREAEPKMRAIPAPARGAPEVSGRDPTGLGKPVGSAPKSRMRPRAGPKKGASRTATPEPGVACPKCGAPMVRRTGKRGPFLGCSRYPQCKGTRGIVGTAAG